MKKKSFSQIFKKFNTIKKLILILLVLLIIGILVYNKKIFEAMTTINIYTDKQDSKINQEVSSNVTPYDNSNKYNENSNGLETTTTTSIPETTSIPSNTTSSVAPTQTTKPVETPQTKSTDDAIARKTASYSNAFTGPLKQT
jgi:cytoskeletal protein RodZ